jgi:carbon monoxide dehydrogenase subunit G
MEHIELSVQIKAPAELVWNRITDWPSQSEWMLGTIVTGTANSVGGTFKAFTGIGPIGFLDTMEITRWEPPFRCDVLHTGKVVKGTGSFQVEKIDANNSKFIWIEDLDIPLGIIGLIGFKLLRPFFVSGVKQSLNKFAKSVTDFAK